MRNRILVPATLLVPATAPAQAKDPQPGPRWSLVIHGGAGVRERGKVTPETDAALRAGVAHEICARMRLGGQGWQAAADGENGFSFNTRSMNRARVTSAGAREVAIYGDEGHKPVQ